MNNGMGHEKICSLSVEAYDAIMKSMMLACAKQINLPSKVKSLYRLCSGRDLSDEIVQEIVDKIVNTEKLGDRYTYGNYVRCFTEVLERRGLIKRISENKLYFCGLVR